MPASTPFINSDGTLDTTQILQEAIPLAKLIGLIIGVALVPLVPVFLLGGRSATGLLFMIVAQFILAVGTGIVLMYVIARAAALTGE